MLQHKKKNDLTKSSLNPENFLNMHLIKILS